MKKGFTLIELIASMAISAVLLSFAAVVFTKYLNNFQKYNYTEKLNSFCDEFFIIFEQHISENMQQIEVSNNDVIIMYSNNQKKKIHYDNESKKIFVNYYDEEKKCFTTANVICTNVKEMRVNKKENVLYINVINNRGVKFERCFGIKKLYE